MYHGLVSLLMQFPQPKYLSLHHLLKYCSYFKAWLDCHFFHEVVPCFPLSISLFFLLLQHDVYILSHHVFDPVQRVYLMSLQFTWESTRERDCLSIFCIIQSSLTALNKCLMSEQTS